MNRHQRRAYKPGPHDPKKSDLDVLSARADTTGCDICHIRFAEAAPYVVARTRTNTFTVRCVVCAEYGGASPVMIGTFLGQGDPWSADDREWFKANPTRRYRLRDPWNGELHETAMNTGSMPKLEAFREVVESQGLHLAIIVHQVAPGKRIRRIVGAPNSDPTDSYTEAGIFKMFPGLQAAIGEMIPANQAEWESANETRVTGRIDRWKHLVAKEDPT